MGIILAVVALSVVCSTRESRDAGAEAVKPLGRIAFAATLMIWAAVLLF